MKSFFILFLLIFVLASLAQLLLPWWVVLPLCLGLAAWRGGSARAAFGAGLLGVALSWWLPAAWLNLNGAGLLAGRVATLLPLGGNSWLLVLLSGLLAGLVGGLAALGGAWLRVSK
ncbi:hypothetical protein D0N36_04165 [Hymenobacter lapidiphilus]|uniref:hypothetical protein n=1 Tax=Hymenobacter sp. CCM 8763 TaxID=2303334 RepID=UPI000E353C04|nr:hypothetical protein [Hymenobacter sp. CCM 8763]RFP66220.1 hypothetical protein D0N36_04165 [Hymenobacter sp. CCM 8763]